MDFVGRLFCFQGQESTFNVTFWANMDKNSLKCSEKRKHLHFNNNRITQYMLRMITSQISILESNLKNHFISNTLFNTQKKVRQPTFKIAMVAKWKHFSNEIKKPRFSNDIHGRSWHLNAGYSSCWQSLPVLADASLTFDPADRELFFKASSTLISEFLSVPLHFNTQPPHLHLSLSLCHTHIHGWCQRHLSIAEQYFK